MWSGEEQSECHILMEEKTAHWGLSLGQSETLIEG